MYFKSPKIWRFLADEGWISYGCASVAPAALFGVAGALQRDTSRGPASEAPRLNNPFYSQLLTSGAVHITNTS